MSARPILFSGPMIRALLEGRKTQTRRAVKARDLGFDNEDVMDFPAELLPSDFAGAKCPYGVPGDLLWVRETWARDDDDGTLMYKASRDDDNNSDWQWLCDHGMARWKPSIHMPRAASRLTLRITGVRVQRLSDINGLDAVAEGLVDLGIEGARWHWEHSAKWGHFAPWRAYRALWESINGPGSWAANPWVWAITFDVIQRNVDQVQP